MNDIFISYSRKDLEAAIQVEERLKSEGWTVFRDSRILTGSEWHKVVLKEAEEDRCMVVLWSKDSIGSEWVLEEVEIGHGRGVLLPLFLDSTMPPLPFSSIQGTNALKQGEKLINPQAISDLVWAIGMKCGSKQSLSLSTPEIYVVVSWRKYWPVVGPMINVKCKFENKSERMITMPLLTATVRGPQPLPLHFSLKCPFEFVGNLQLARSGENNLVEIVPGSYECGIQLEAPLDRKRNVWLPGEYSFDFKGWTDHGRFDPPNFRTRVEASVSKEIAQKIDSLFEADDAAWEALKASDNAKAIKIDVLDIMAGLPVTDEPISRGSSSRV